MPLSLSLSLSLTEGGLPELLYGIHISLDQFWVWLSVKICLWLLLKWCYDNSHWVMLAFSGSVLSSSNWEKLFATASQVYDCAIPLFSASGSGCNSWESLFAAASQAYDCAIPLLSASGSGYARLESCYTSNKTYPMQALLGGLASGPPVLTWYMQINNRLDNLF